MAKRKRKKKLPDSVYKKAAEVVGKYKDLPKEIRNKVIGKLGGEARAKSLTKEQLSAISAKGGLVTYLRYGSEHFRKMATSSQSSLSPEEREALKKKRQQMMAKARAKLARIRKFKKLNKDRKTNTSESDEL